MRSPWFLVLSGLTFSAWPLAAQENPPPPPPDAPASPPAANSATAQPAAQLVRPADVSAAQDKTPVRERERRVYVPFEDLEKVFQDQGRGVFLPYREFLELWDELTLRREEDDKPPPAAAALTHAEYTGRVEDSGLVLEARLTAESFVEGWTSLPFMGKNGPGISEARTGRAVLSRRADGADLLLPGKGVHEITLKMHAPARHSGSGGRVTLALPPAGVSRLTMTVPGTGLAFETTPAAAHTAEEDATTGATVFSSFFGSSAEQVISWSAREVVAEMPPLILAEMRLDTLIGAGALTTRADITWRVLRAPVAELRVGLPAGEEVIGVTAPGIREWKIETAADGARTLLLLGEKPLREEQKAQIVLESAIAALPATVKTPALLLHGAAHARGLAVVRSEPQLDAAARQMNGAARAQSAPITSSAYVSAVSTPAAAGSAVPVEVGAFRLLRQPYELTFEVTEARPQVEAASHARVEITRDQARLSAQVQYDIRRVGIFELRLGLPAGWSAQSLKGEDVAEWRTETVDGAPVLVVRLKGQKTGSTQLELAATARRAALDDFTLPVLAPAEVIRHEALLGVKLHPGLEANTKDAGGFQQEDGDTLTRSAPAIFTERADLAFRYRDAAAPAVLAFKSRAAQVSVEVLTLLEALEQSTRHTWTLAFDVAYAATDRFVLALPRAVAETVRFVDPQILEINRDHQPAAAPALPDAEKFVFWEIVLRGEKQGVFEITGSHEQAAMIESGGSARVELMPVHVPGAFQETGQVAVAKAESLEIRSAEAGTLEEMDARELRPPLNLAGAFLAYKYRAPPVSLAVELARNSYFAVPQAIVTHADLVTAAATDRAQTTEAVYWVKNNDLQFLVVRLPAGARLVSEVFVDREPQQPMRREGSDDLLVRLPSGAGRAAFPVRFVFESPSERPGEKLGWLGSLLIHAPELPEAGVLETRHRLYLPEGWSYTGVKGPLTRESAERSWTRARRLLDPLIPAFGPLPESVAQAVWSQPPEVAADTRALYGFQVPRQGRLETLRRLGPPAQVSVSFRLKKLGFALEALAFLGVLLGGMACARRPAAQKLLLLAGAGFGALLLTGLLGAANAQVALAAMLAAGLLALLWVSVILWSALAAWRRKAPPNPRAGGGAATPGGPAVQSGPTSQTGQTRPTGPPPSAPTTTENPPPPVP
ncbi:MAG TPA: hypothetical protein DIT64_14185 [Verrucomicrobiales bacterium]|nr:hypothetical protein [Verrucomicrobiales bacterium]